MMTDNVLSSQAVFASTSSPTKQPGPADLLVDYELGGVAIQDPSQGLEVKVWTIRGAVDKDTGNVSVLLSAPGTPASELFSGADITELSLAFDQNMRPFVAFVQAGAAKHYWYDPTAAAYVTTTLPAGVTSPRCTLDDHRDLNLSNSDIILGYIRAGNLCFRQQRDRYQTEYVLCAAGADAQLISVGMNQVYRLQFRLRNFSASTDGQMAVSVAPYLGDVVLDLCRRAGIPAENIDVSELYDDVVVGYMINSDDGVDRMLGPLQQAFFFDPTEFDRKLRFFKRGRDVVMSVSYLDLVDDEDAPMKQTRVQEDKLPRVVNVNHIDPAGGFAKNKQYAQRKSNAVKAKGEKTLDFNMVLTSDQAVQAASKTLKVAWHELMSYAFSLPIGFSALVPGDVFDFFAKDGSVQRIRIETRNEDGNIIKFEGKQDAGKATYDSKAIGFSLPPPLSTAPGLVGDTRLELLNLSPLRDQDDELGIYVALAGSSSAWYGAQILVSTDGGTSYFEAYRGEQPATLGDTETELLAEVSSEYPSYQSVTVAVNFPLESVALETLLNNYNRCVIGDEVLQFQTATPLGNNRFVLSGLIRGRYHTTPDAWPVGTRFVLLDSSVAFIQAQKWMLGRELLFKPVSFGLTEDESVPTAYEFDVAMSQREWPPHHVEAVRDGSDSVVVSWIPRPRLGVETNPYDSKYFSGFKVKFSDGFTATTTSTSYTRASTPAGATVSVCGLNSITGDGDYSEEVPT